MLLNHCMMSWIVYGRIRASILNMALCGTDIICIWSTVSTLYVKDKCWLLSSQKAVWLLTIRYFWWLPLDFHLDRGWRLEYRICWSVTPLTMFPCSMEVIPACNVVTFNWTDIQFIEKILVFSAIYRGPCIGNRKGWLLKYGYLTCICLNRKKRCLHGIVAGSE